MHMGTALHSYLFTVGSPLEFKCPAQGLLAIKFSAVSGIQSCRPLLLMLLFRLFYAALCFPPPDNEWWQLSQVCTVALPEMIACIFGQAPFPLKDIVSICCNDRIMASHLVLHPQFAFTYEHMHTCTRIHVHARWCTKEETRPELSERKFFWLRG